MTKLKIRVLGDRDQVGVDCSKDTPVTKQSFREECDINVLMKSYKKTGVLEHLARGLPSYGDFTNAEDYHTASNQVIAAQKAFDELPSEIRSRMDNDPHALLEFLEDEENREEAVSLGLLPEPPKAAAPTETGGSEGKSPPASEGATAPVVPAGTVKQEGE